MKTAPKPQPAIDPALLLDPPRRRRGFGCLFWLLILGGLAAGGYYFYAARQKQAGQSAAPQIEYKTEKASIGDVVVAVTATGALQPTNQVDVGSELSGNVEAVLVDYNDQVKAGQVLAKLDVSKLKAQVEQTQASLAAAKAKVLTAEATIQETASKLGQLRKMWELSGGKTPSQFDLDAAAAAAARAKAEKASAEAGVAEVQAKLNMTQTDLGKAEILSPVNGIVLARSIEPGQTVAASFSAPVLFKLAEDLTKMELQVDVDEADIGQVKEGQQAKFTVDAYPERKFSAVIRQVRFASTVNNGVVTYKTVLMVDNSDLALRPGMTATAEIAVQKAENALIVPTAALRFSPQAQDKGEQKKGSFLDSLMIRPRFSGGGKRPAKPDGKGPQQVWTLGRDGQPQAVPVKTGLSDGSSTQILEGELKEGDAVITAAVADGKGKGR
ncbi:efflux RND transporter periplasmic adaptor subunit [Candidatus Electronema sp. JM]|uniref:efflux RND transporter periplasmic adaptor subunit n=1 Tax=Candidatus Electronema sp. JM TaxID=3401571 RepID=UPI003AA9244D